MKYVTFYLSVSSFIYFKFLASSSARDIISCLQLEQQPSVEEKANGPNPASTFVEDGLGEADELAYQLFSNSSNSKCLPVVTSLKVGYFAI